MAVTWLRRFAFARPHVFVTCVPGGAAARLAVERFAREQGWPLAASPADADLLVVCGTPAGWLADAVEIVWAQLPEPRARVHLADADGTPDALLEARAALLAPVPAPPIDEQAMANEHAAHEPHESADHSEHAEQSEHAEHGGHGEQHGEHDGQGEHSAHDGHGGHGGHHDHMGMDVAGLPMADRGPDRDGLRLDELAVSLGPFLPAWPAGLRLHLKLQGDVAHQVAVEAEPAVEADAQVFTGDPGRLAAGRLDALAALLEVAGADGHALRARVLRDRLLAGDTDGSALARFARKLRRARLLRAATDGVADLHGLDATARWQLWLTESQQALAGEPVGSLAWPFTPEELGELLTGLELGGLRVAVASLVSPTGLPAGVGSAVHAHG
jgi:hypothetical protein